MPTREASESRMTLLDWPERGAKVSNRAAACPCCGNPHEPSVAAVEPQQNPYMLSAQAIISLERHRPTPMLISQEHAAHSFWSLSRLR